MTKSKQIQHQDLCLTAVDGIRENSVIKLRQCDDRNSAQVGQVFICLCYFH